MLGLGVKRRQEIVDVRTDSGQARGRTRYIGCTSSLCPDTLAPGRRNRYRGRLANEVVQIWHKVGIAGECQRPGTASVGAARREAASFCWRGVRLLLQRFARGLAVGRQRIAGKRVRGAVVLREGA
jgi:hypothetical protein